MLNRKNAKLRRALFTPLALVLAVVLAFGGTMSTIVMATDAMGENPATVDPMENIGGNPAGGAPEGGAPEGGAPEGGAPEGGAPEGGAPEGGAPEGGQGTTVDLGNGTVLNRNADGSLTGPDGTAYQTDEDGNPLLDEDGNPIPQLGASALGTPLSLLEGAPKLENFTFTFSGNRISGIDSYSDSTIAYLPFIWNQDVNGGGTIDWAIDVDAMAVLAGIDPADVAAMFDETSGTLDVTREQEDEIVREGSFTGGGGQLVVSFKELKETDPQSITQVQSGEKFQVELSYSFAPGTFNSNGKIVVDLPDFFETNEGVITFTSMTNLKSYEVVNNQLTITLEDDIEGEGHQNMIAFIAEFKNGITPNGFEGDFAATLDANSKPSKGSTISKPIAQVTAEETTITVQAAEVWTVTKTLNANQPVDVKDGAGKVTGYNATFTITVKSDKTDGTNKTGRLYITDYDLTDLISRAASDAGTDHTPGVKWQVKNPNGANAESFKLQEGGPLTEANYLSTAKTFEVTVFFPAADFTTNHENWVGDGSANKSTIKNTAELKYKVAGVDTYIEVEDDATVNIGGKGNEPSATINITKMVKINNGTATVLNSATQNTYKTGVPSFTITKDGDSTFAPQTLIIGTDGKVSFTGLKAGTYIITETRNTLLSQFDIDNPSYVWVDNKGNDDTITITNAQAVNGDVFNVTVTNTSPAGSFVTLTIDKKDITNNIPLSGVTFTLFNVDEHDVKTGTAKTSGTTDLNGKVSFENLPAGKYWLEETPPAGYEPQNAASDYISGKLITVADPNGANGNKQTITVNNVFKGATVQFYKKFIGPDGEIFEIKAQDGDASTLPSFEIHQKGTDGTYTKYTDITPLLIWDDSIGNTGVAGTKVRLPAGEYQLWETNMNGLNGFVLPTAALATFTVTDDGKTYTIVNDTPTLVEGEVDGKPFVNSSTLGRLTLTKEMAKAAPTATGKAYIDTTANGSVKFDYYDKADTNKVTTEITITIKNGEGTFSKDLPPGTYVFTEKSTINGYQLLSDPFEITVSKGTVNNNDGDKIIQNHKLGGIRIIKVDFTDPNTQLTGAEFELWQKQSDNNYTKIDNPNMTASDGVYTFSNLAPGEYRIRETTAPDGYQLKGDYTVAIDASAKTIEVKLYDNTEVKVENFPEASVTIEKRDSISGDHIGGAKFQLQKKDGTDYVDSGTVQTVPNSGTNEGKLTFSGLDDGWYRIVETAAPSNYFAPTADMYVQFEVVNGEVKNITQANTVMIELPTSTGVAITFKNKKMADLTVLKRGDTGTNPGHYNVPLKDAEFKLYENPYDPDTSDALTFSGGSNGTYTVSGEGTVTTILKTQGDLGQLIIKGLDPAKTYTLVEIKAPGGYVIMGDGQTTITFSGDEKYEKTVEITNDASKVKVRVEKFGEDLTDPVHPEKINENVFDAHFVLLTDATLADDIAKLVKDNIDTIENRDAMLKLVSDMLKDPANIGKWIGQRYMVTGSEDNTGRNTALSDWFDKSILVNDIAYLVEILPPVLHGYSLPEGNYTAIITRVDMSATLNGEVKLERVIDPYNDEGGGGEIFYGQIQVEKRSEKDEKGKFFNLNGAEFEIWASMNDGEGNLSKVLLDTIVTGSDGGANATDPRPGFAISRIIELGEKLYTTKTPINTDDLTKGYHYELVITIREKTPPAGYKLSGILEKTITLTSDTTGVTEDGVLPLDKTLTGDINTAIAGAFVNPDADGGYFTITKTYNNTSNISIAIPTDTTVYFNVYEDAALKKPYKGVPGAEIIDGNYVIRSGKTYGPVGEKTLWLEERVESVAGNYNVAAPFSITVKKTDTFGDPLVKTVTNYAYLALQVQKTNTSAAPITFTKSQSAEFSVYEATVSGDNVTWDAASFATAQKGNAANNAAVSFSKPLPDGTYVMLEKTFTGFTDYYRATGDNTIIVKFVVRDGKIETMDKKDTPADDRIQHSYNNGKSFDLPSDSGWVSGKIIRFPNPELGTIIVQKKLQELSMTAKDAVPAGTGFTFELYNVQTGGDPIRDAVETDSNGQVKFTGLEADTYYIEETAAADGYSLLTGRVTVELTTDGQGNVNNITVGAHDNATLNNTSGNVEITNKTNKAYVQIGKYSAVGSREPITNAATFAVYAINAAGNGPDGTALGTYSTQSGTVGNNRTDAFALTAGDYWFEETVAPAGYGLPYTSANGAGMKVTIAPQSAPGAVREVKFYDPPLAAFEIKKIDAKSSAPITSGTAVFNVYAKGAGAFDPSNPGTLVTSFITSVNADGLYAINTPLDAGTYVLVETTPPLGYELETPSNRWYAEFTVSRTDNPSKGIVPTEDDPGSVTYTVDFPALAPASGRWDGTLGIITIPNTRTGFELIIEKYSTKKNASGNDERLADAVYTIIGVNNPNGVTTYTRYTSDLKSLAIGCDSILLPLHDEYWILETAAPANHSNLLEDTWVKVESRNGPTVEYGATANAMEITYEGQTYTGYKLTKSTAYEDNGSYYVKVAFKNQSMAVDTSISLKKTTTTPALNLYSDNPADRTATFTISDIYTGGNETPLKNFTLTDNEIKFYLADGTTEAEPSSVGAYKITNVTTPDAADSYNLTYEGAADKPSGFVIKYGQKVGDDYFTPVNFNPSAVTVEIVFDQRLSDPTVDEVGKITNTARVRFDYKTTTGYIEATANSSANLDVVAVNRDVPQVAITKDIRSANQVFAPGTKLDYQLLIQNHDASLPMIDPVVIDVLDKNLTYADSSEWPNNGVTFKDFTTGLNLVSRTPGTIGSGENEKSVMIWKFQGTLPPSGKIQIDYKVLIDPSVQPAKKLENHAYLTSAQLGIRSAQDPDGLLFKQLGSTDAPQLNPTLDGFVNGDPDFETKYLHAQRDVTTGKASGSKLTKLHKTGNLSYTGDTLDIQPGDSVDYMLTLTTDSRLVNDIVIADVFPYVQDKFTAYPDSSRKTAWEDAYLTLESGITVTAKDENGSPIPGFTDANYTLYYLGTKPASGGANVKETVTKVGFDSPWDTTGGTDIYGIGLKTQNFTLEANQTLVVEFTVKAKDTINPNDYAKVRIGYNSAAFFTEGKASVDTYKVGVRFVTAPVKIGDRIWHDTNANGIQDTGELAIKDATATLQELQKDGSWKDIADVDGKTTERIDDEDDTYSFWVKPYITADKHTYKIKFELPDGYVYTDVIDKTTDNSDAIPSTVAGESKIGYTEAFTVDLDGKITWDSGTVENGLGCSMTLDAGAYKLAAIGNYVWFDANGNGIQDDDSHQNAHDAALKAVVVRLFDEDGTKKGEIAIPNSSDPATGNYLFEGLRPGNYTVMIDIGHDELKQYQFTQPDMDTSPADPEDTRDSRQLHDNIGGAEIGYGDYARVGYAATITVESGEYNEVQDFGLERIYTLIGDYVWYDADFNGIQSDAIPDPGERGIQGVEVSLQVTHDGGTTWESVIHFDGTPVTSEITDADGYYEFTQIPFGEYRVIFDLTTVTDGKTYKFTNMVTGGVNATEPDSRVALTQLLPDGVTQVSTPSNNGVTNVFTLSEESQNSIGSPGMVVFSVLYVDAGAYIPASIGDYVWHDANRNGVQDDNEVGIDGAKVRLYKETTDGGLVVQGADETTRTEKGKAGYYLFDGLEPGIYQVEFDRPSRYNTTTGNISGNPTKDSDVLEFGSRGKTARIELASDEDNMDIDAGYYYVSEETITTPPPTPTPSVTPTENTPTPTPTPSITASTVLFELPPDEPEEVTVELLDLPDDEIPYGAIKPPASRSVDLTEEELPYGIVKTGEMAADMIAYLAVGLVIAAGGIGLMMADRRRKAAGK